MAIHRELFFGLYIKVKPFEIEELIERRECKNENCSEKGKETDSNFCSNCGAKIENVERSAVTLTTDLYELLENRDEYLLDYYLSGSEYHKDIFFAYRTNFIGEYFEEQNLLGLDIERMKNDAIADFGYEEFFKFLRSILGNEAFEVRYGLLQTYN